MKYIIITGGVASGLGKGVSSSSLSHLLQLQGYEVTMIKIDPYLNEDAGTMSPFEHGEVYVLNDGSEVDLDLGSYERFLNITLTGDHNITTGKMYRQVFEKERKGEYLGQTVQVIPHLVDHVVNHIKNISKKPVRGGDNGKTPEICLIELGGTVGDLESSVFLESLRRLKNKSQDFCHIHVSLVPIIVREQKSKPVQHSYKQLCLMGLTPDFIFCRCDEPVNDTIKNKISSFTGLEKNRILSVHNVSNIYKVPGLLQNQGIVDLILGKKGKKIISPFSYLLSASEEKNIIELRIIGKYSKFTDSYLSLQKAILHASIKNKIKVNIIWNNLDGYFHGVLVPGGFGKRGVKEKIEACRIARERGIPFLGICFGFQLGVIEYCRNVLGIEANSEEITQKRDEIITNMYRGEKLGGTMLKGLKQFETKQGTLLREIYGMTGEERFRHRYGINPSYSDQIEEKGLVWSGTIGENKKAFELKSHPFYVGVQYHPEYLSRIESPSEIFVRFLCYMKEYRDGNMV